MCAVTHDSPSPLAEHKRRPDGREETYHCTLVAYDGRRLIARYVYEQDFHADGRRLPKGGWTIAWYWRHRRYLLYRMYAPDGAHIADRFDVIDQVRLRADRASYRDLYLDMWVDGPAPALEDEAELDAAEANGLLTPTEALNARRTGRLLLRRHRRIIAETEGGP